MADDVPPRAKLQLSEYYYAFRQFQQAIVIAKEIATQCQTKHDLIGTGESFYYVQRA